MKTYSMPYRGGASPPNRQGIVVCNMGRNRISEAECHKRLEGRPLRMVEYGGTTHVGSSFFECLICKHVWKAKFHNIDGLKRGCPKCGTLKTSAAKLLSTDELHKRLEGRFIKMINYAGTVNKNSTFKCLVCSNVWKAKFSNIHVGKKGCPKCGKLKAAKSRSVPIEECYVRLEGRPLRMLHYVGDVKGNGSLFECNICQYKWSSTFGNIDAGHGCPVCTKSGFNPIKPAWLYVLRISSIKGDCYGFGITSNLKSRMCEHKKNLGCMLEEIYEPYYFDSGKHAQELESIWKQSPYVVDINVAGFKTECMLITPETTKMIFG